MKPLLTARLMIREFTPADTDAYSRLMSACFGSTDTPDETRDWIAWTVLNYRQLERMHQPPYGDYAVCLGEEAALIGSVGLVPSMVPWGVLTGDPDTGQPADARTSAEFGLFWAIAPEHQHQGFATEAAQVLIDLVFSRLNAHRIIATTGFDNLASQGVMRRLGMTIMQNTGREPFWCQVVGVLDQPSGG